MWIRINQHVEEVSVKKNNECLDWRNYSIQNRNRKEEEGTELKDKTTIRISQRVLSIHIAKKQYESFSRS